MDVVRHIRTVGPAVPAEIVKKYQEDGYGFPAGALIARGVGFLSFQLGGDGSYFCIAGDKINEQLMGSIGPPPPDDPTTLGGDFDDWNWVSVSAVSSPEYADAIVQGIIGSTFVGFEVLLKDRAVGGPSRVIGICPRLDTGTMFAVAPNLELHITPEYGAGGLPIFDNDNLNEQRFDRRVHLA